MFSTALGFYFIMVFFIYAKKRRMNWLTSLIPVMFHVLLNMHKHEGFDTEAGGINKYG